MVIRYAISRVLDLRLFGELAILSNASSLSLYSLATKVRRVLTEAQMNGTVWKRGIAKKLIQQNIHKLLANIQVLQDDTDIPITSETAATVCLSIIFSGAASL